MGRNMKLIVLIEEQIIAISIKETLMAVHPRAINSEDGFGHEGGRQPMLGSDRFDGVLQRQNIISRLDCIRKTKVNFMLSESHLVVSDLHLESHGLQCIHQFGADTGSFIK